MNTKNIAIIGTVIVLVVALAVLFTGNKKVEGPQKSGVVSKKIKIELPPAEGEKTPAPPTESLTKAETVAPAPAVPPETKVAKKVEEPVAKPPPPAPAPKPQPAATQERPVGRWAVNLASYAENVHAEKLRDKLKSQGHNAYLTQAEVKGTTWHRVRIGFYHSSEEAAEYAVEISKAHRLPKAWVVQPSWEEITKNRP